MRSASLWAIRISMGVLAVGYWIQAATGVRASRCLGGLGLFGAALATIHMGTALEAFHGGSLGAAVESTAQRTEAMFGFRVGAGVYVNYAFVVVWWVDAFLRWLGRPIPVGLCWLIDGFLIAMAISGSIVFASGPIRWVGIAWLATGLGIQAWRWGREASLLRDRVVGDTGGREGRDRSADSSA